ncbi:Disintegrin and metalloproteinase domain-containing protein 20 [Heterocephalus glaber]|uniref:Disintegrin and metalloproteinase domain-containing protein 20 n=1 Tax=Heterocephalus glaber TaxID=10181 RepID=G5BQL6_HETGA|nr:Disintegrin and metalloproteinase domain-containing protein 20 [Heterocephalus glaber]
MGPPWAQNFLTGALCLPVFWAVLCPACCSHDPPIWRFTSSEVLIPRKEPHRVDGSKMPDQLSYSMRFRGQRHVIRMKLKKNFLPRHFPVITNNDQGAMQEDYPYLEGVPGSTATLDTCSGGLRGMLQVDDFTYEIKPLEASSKFEHVVSQLVSQYASEEDERCTIPEEEAIQELEEVKLAESPRATPVYLWRVHMKQANIHYTISNSLWLQEKNYSRLVENVVIINNIIHSIYRPMGLNIYVRVLFIWEQWDYVDLQTIPVRLAISNFGLYKLHAWFHKIPHTTSMLLTGHKVANTTYFSNPGGLCNANWGAMYVFIIRYHLFLGASVLAHALGHNIGMRHDSAGCACFRRTSCLMAPVPDLHDVASNCSFEALHKRIHGYDACLSVRYPPYYNFPYVAPRCGDRIVNNKEECDCGSLKECTKNTCCGTNCLFTPGTLCDMGDCCYRCKYAGPGTICRDKLGICDLPEHCDGKVEKCPDNFYIQDGTPCSPNAVCMRGNCSDHDLQCQALFGYKVKDASSLCYEKLNTIGDRFGNCGLKLQRHGSVPAQCLPTDVLCGILHCSRPENVPGGGEHTTCHDIIVKEDTEEHCFGYDVHHGTEIPEIALVVDGATCGPGKYCLHQNCTFHQDLYFDCDVQVCHFRGVCNNKKHCHCLRGYKPPNCTDKGPGGSVDSGPPPDREEGIRAHIIVSLNQELLLIIIRLGLFLAAILVSVLTK